MGTLFDKEQKVNTDSIKEVATKSAKSHADKIKANVAVGKAIDDAHTAKRVAQATAMKANSRKEEGVVAAAALS